MKNDLLKWLRHYISPAFLIMLTASFVLWYIAKLSYSYTTDLNINVKVANSRFDVNCVVEGVGTNLFGYRLYKGGKVTIPLTELQYSAVMSDDGQNIVVIEPQSLQNALSVRYSDIKVVSVGALPQIEMSREELSRFTK